MRIRVRKEKKMKLLGSILLVLTVLFAQVGTVAAAPQLQDGTVTITGTVLEIGQPVTDENGVTTVPVKIETAEGVQIVSVSPDVAATLVLDTPATVTVNPEDVVADEEPAEADVHPISAMLAEFFHVDASMVDSFHNGEFQIGEGEDAESQVFGFGVIAQALWMATNDEGETSVTDIELATAILEAKQSGDYSKAAEMLGMDPEDVPSNWGQFKKALKDKHENLGAAHHPDDNDAANDQDPGKGKNNENKKPKKNNGHGKP
jgi:hypothetical protein